MDQFSAFFTFAVKTDLCILIAVRFNIFKTGRAVPVNGILLDYALIDQRFQLTVDRRLSDFENL